MVRLQLSAQTNKTEMKTENNKDNKIRFNALYWGQLIMISPDSQTPYFITENTIRNNWPLSLRKISDITDEEAIQVARFAHQKTQADFKVERGNGIIHVQYTDHIGITYHISILQDYGSVNANINFKETKTQKFESFKVNIGEISLSSTLPLPYVAICDYLRNQGFLIPFNDLTVKNLIQYGWVNFKSNDQVR